MLMLEPSSRYEPTPSTPLVLSGIVTRTLRRTADMQGGRGPLMRPGVRFRSPSRLYHVVRMNSPPHPHTHLRSPLRRSLRTLSRTPFSRSRLLSRLSSPRRCPPPLPFSRNAARKSSYSAVVVFSPPASPNPAHPCFVKKTGLSLKRAYFS